MSQASNWGVPSVGPATPTVMATRMNESFNALLSGNKGASRPSYAVAGTEWIDDSGTPWIVYRYDGTQDIEIARVDPSYHFVRLPGARVDVRQFGATGDGETDDHAALQAALDRAAGQFELYVPPGTYRISQALEFPSNTRLFGTGSDLTIFKLTDDADEDSNVFQPAAYDGSIENCLFYGFKIDGNYSRATVSGTGTDRPGASGFVTAGAKNIYLEDVIAVDCVAHGIDICNGGEDDGGTLKYITAAHAVDGTYYPDNMSADIFLVRCGGDNCGDDGITTHYCDRVWIDKCFGVNTGGRHGPGASAGIEVDDGSRDVWVIDSRGDNCNIAFSCKSHNGTPAPRRVHFVNCVAENSNEGFFLQEPGNQVSYTPVYYTNCVVRNPKDVEDPAETPIHAFYLNRWTGDVYIDNPDIYAPDDTEATLSNAIYCRLDGRYHIRGGSIKGWPRTNTSDSDVAAIRINSGVNRMDIAGTTFVNCGYRVIRSSQNTAGQVLRLDNLTIIGEDVASSVAIHTTSALGGNLEISVGALSISGYPTKTTFGSVSRTNPTGVARGVVVNGGMLSLGPSVTKTISSGAITVGDASYIRVAGEGGSADDLDTINGGNEGDILVLRSASTPVDITVKHGTGNILLNGETDFVLSSARDSLVLICNSAGEWTEFGRGDNAT